MNFKLLFSALVVALFSITSMFASFPVTRTVTQTTTESSSNNSTQKAEEVFTSPAAAASYDKWVAAAFWFFLGWPFAAHRWYAGKPIGWNILFIISFAGLGIWAIFDIVNILLDKFN